MNKRHSEKDNNTYEFDSEKEQYEEERFQEELDEQNKLDEQKAFDELDEDFETIKGNEIPNEYLDRDHDWYDYGN